MPFWIPGAVNPRCSYPIEPSPCHVTTTRALEARLFNVLTGRIREITDIFGTIPDFITDNWVTAMMEDRAG
jgi:hypothetical protein